MKNQFSKYLFFLFLLFAFLERVIFDLGPNIEAFTAVFVLASFYFKDMKLISLTLLFYVLSDLLIGTTSISIFVYSGFLIPPILLLFLSRCGLFRNQALLRPHLIGSLSSNLFFFIWTNFGVWLLDSWGMYPKTIYGLVHCYINALPFFRNQIISSIVFAPLFYLILRVANNKNFINNTLCGKRYCIS